MKNYFWYISAFLILSLFSVLLGVGLDLIPKIYSQILFVVSVGGVLIMNFYKPKEECIDTKNLPDLSDNVLNICDSSNFTFSSKEYANAIKLYMKEEGASFNEAIAKIKEHKLDSKCKND